MFSKELKELIRKQSEYRKKHGPSPFEKRLEKISKKYQESWGDQSFPLPDMFKIKKEK